MGRVYAVASAKGGVGKTTTTANLGVALVAAGHRVAVVDADVGMPNLGRMLGVAPAGPTLHDVLAGEAEPLDAVYEGPRGLAVVPGSTALDAYAKATPRRLRRVVDALADYDVVLIDTGAGMSHDTLLPLGLADAVILVSTPTTDALGDTEKTRQLTQRLGVPVAGLVLSRVDTARVDIEALAADFAADLLEVVPEDPAVDDGTSVGDPVVTRDADSPAAAAYRALADALTAQAMDAEFEESAVAVEARQTRQDEAAEPGDGSGADGTDDAVGADTGEAGGHVGDDADSEFSTVLDETPDGLDGTDDVDLSSALDDAPDDIDADDIDLSSILEENGDERVDEADVASLLDQATDESAPDADAAATAAEDTSDPEESAESEGPEPSESTANSGGGLASTLADVEGADDTDEATTETPADAEDAEDAEDVDDGADPVSVSEVVEEAEPDTDVTFDTAPEEDSGVTISPDDAPDIPDAEADADDTRTAAEASDDAAGDEAAGTDTAAADTDASDDGDDGDEEAEKKGLFRRFFG